MNEEMEANRETPTGGGAAAASETARERDAAERMISELKSAYESAARLRESPAHRRIALEIARALKKPSA
ncbi:MAG: hypothetical protein ACI4QA_03855 [Candidatus Spyradosoma sp.]